ncbi:nuclear transport factor 2 family protein [Novosphingobium aquiterrae]|uniref:Nuclear transport factor 2 family protein n=1 Tax=Novosphingobium aquiterrae TaxID=624388 RepID=A0ABV6PDY3_9SPHN
MDDTDSVATVRALETRLQVAMLAGDVSTLDALIDDRLVFTTPDGTVTGKEQDLAAHANGMLRLSKLDITDSTLWPLDDQVVATVRADLAGSYAGATFAGTFAYTRLWQCTSGSWRIVAGHASQLT